ncbi:ABC transporter permease [Kaistia sp. 32K]|uniref:carbohydrate ABC transporter permease n=1 Tax=Kaistia sp. 32K TaxID=2795690 RepID=UPI0019168F80|nr:sugar ABC transporter permease [Kaistia sp. 32K]BCP52743.1 ABC transporter permease [Kaistia sp. 32K]
MKPRRRKNVASYVALIPAFIIVVFAYLGTMLWTVQISFTDSRLLPSMNFIGIRQYERLFATPRWIISLENMVIFGVGLIFVCLILGFLMAAALDQKIRFENTFRTIFLYPYAMSFIVTGLAWQWILNPTLGVQQYVRNLGWTDFRFDWIIQNDKAIYVVIIAGVWQASGLVMALMLAGLRGIDQELWKASRVDGIPAWRVYLNIVVPMLRPTIITSVVLLSLAVVRVYDLVIALTGGGPGIASEVPAKFILDYLFGRSNIGLATAASSVLLVIVLVIITPWLYYEYFRPERAKGAK